VTHPLRYYSQPWNKSDRHGLAQLTRFAGPAVLRHFVQVQAGPDAPADEAPRARTTSASIRRGVRALWD